MIRRSISSATDVIGLNTWLDSACFDGLGTVGEETTLYGAIGVKSCTIYHGNIQETDQRNGHQNQSHSPPRHNAVLPVVNVLVNGDWCSALIDSGYSRSIFSTERDASFGTEGILTDDDHTSRSREF